MHAHSQRVNRPLLPPLQNCRCSGMSEALRTSARNRRGPGPDTEQRVAFYLWVSATSLRFDSLMRTSSQRLNEPNSHLLSAFTPAQAHLSFAALPFKKNVNPRIAVSVSGPLFKCARGTVKEVPTTLGSLSDINRDCGHPPPRPNLHLPDWLGPFKCSVGRNIGHIFRLAHSK